MFVNNAISYREKFRYAQDYDLYLRMISQNLTVGCIPKKLVLIRKTTDSISSRNLPEQMAYAKLARRFYHESVGFGEDTYNAFSKDDLPRVSFTKGQLQQKQLENRILMYAEGGHTEQAKEIYRNDFLTSNPPHLRRLMIRIIIAMPGLLTAFRLLKNGT